MAGAGRTAGKSGQAWVKAGAALVERGAFARLLMPSAEQGGFAAIGLILSIPKKQPAPVISSEK